MGRISAGSGTRIPQTACSLGCLSFVDTPGDTRAPRVGTSANSASTTPHPTRTRPRRAAQAEPRQSLWPPRGARPRHRPSAPPRNRQRHSRLRDEARALPSSIARGAQKRCGKQSYRNRSRSALHEQQLSSRARTARQRAAPRDSARSRPRAGASRPHGAPPRCGASRPCALTAPRRRRSAPPRHLACSFLPDDVAPEVLLRVRR